MQKPSDYTIYTYMCARVERFLQYL